MAFDVEWSPLLPSPGPTPGELSRTGPLVLDQVSPVPVWASTGGSGHSVCLRPASSSSRDSVSLSFPDQRHGYHLTPRVFPGSENGTAPKPGGDQLSDPGAALSSLSPTPTPSESTPALPPDCPDAGRLSPSLPAPGPPHPSSLLPPSRRALLDLSQLTAARLSHSPPRPPPPPRPQTRPPATLLWAPPYTHRAFRTCPASALAAFTLHHWNAALPGLSVTCSPPHSGPCSCGGPPSSPATAAPRPPLSLTLTHFLASLPSALSQFSWSFAPCFLPPTPTPNSLW